MTKLACPLSIYLTVGVTMKEQPAEQARTTNIKLITEIIEEQQMPHNGHGPKRKHMSVYGV